MAGKYDFSVSDLVNGVVGSASRLKTNVESIIEKYNKDFPDDDLINLQTMDIVKNGNRGTGVINKSKQLRFGASNLKSTKRKETLMKSWMNSQQFEFDPNVSMAIARQCESVFKKRRNLSQEPSDAETLSSDDEDEGLGNGEDVESINDSSSDEDNNSSSFEEDDPETFYDRQEIHRSADSSEGEEYGYDEIDGDDLVTDKEKSYANEEDVESYSCPQRLNNSDHVKSPKILRKVSLHNSPIKTLSDARKLRKHNTTCEETDERKTMAICVKKHSQGEDENEGDPQSFNDTFVSISSTRSSSYSQTKSVLNLGSTILSPLKLNRSGANETFVVSQPSAPIFGKKSGLSSHAFQDSQTRKAIPLQSDLVKRLAKAQNHSPMSQTVTSVDDVSYYSLYSQKDWKNGRSIRSLGTFSSEDNNGNPSTVSRHTMESSLDAMSAASKIVSESSNISSIDGFKSPQGRRVKRSSSGVIKKFDISTQRDLQTSPLRVEKEVLSPTLQETSPHISPLSKERKNIYISPISRQRDSHFSPVSKPKQDIHISSSSKHLKPEAKAHINCIPLHGSAFSTGVTHSSFSGCSTDFLRFEDQTVESHMRQIPHPQKVTNININQVSHFPSPPSRQKLFHERNSGESSRRDACIDNIVNGINMSLDGYSDDGQEEDMSRVKWVPSDSSIRVEARDSTSAGDETGSKFVIDVEKGKHEYQNAFKSHLETSEKYASHQEIFKSSSNRSFESESCVDQRISSKKEKDYDFNGLSQASDGMRQQQSVSHTSGYQTDGSMLNVTYSIVERSDNERLVHKNYDQDDFSKIVGVARKPLKFNQQRLMMARKRYKPPTTSHLPPPPPLCDELPTDRVNGSDSNRLGSRVSQWVKSLAETRSANASHFPSCPPQIPADFLAGRSPPLVNCQVGIDNPAHKVGASPKVYTVTQSSNNIPGSCGDNTSQRLTRKCNSRRQTTDAYKPSHVQISSARNVRQPCQPCNFQPSGFSSLDSISVLSDREEQERNAEPANEATSGHSPNCCKQHSCQEISPLAKVRKMNPITQDAHSKMLPNKEKRQFKDSSSIVSRLSLYSRGEIGLEDSCRNRKRNWCREEEEHAAMLDRETYLSPCKVNSSVNISTLREANPSLHHQSIGRSPSIHDFSQFQFMDDEEFAQRVSSRIIKNIKKYLCEEMSIDNSNRSSGTFCKNNHDQNDANFTAGKSQTIGHVGSGIPLRAQRMFPEEYVDMFSPSNPHRIDSDDVISEEQDRVLSSLDFKKHIRSFCPRRNQRKDLNRHRPLANKSSPPSTHRRCLLESEISGTDCPLPEGNEINLTNRHHSLGKDLGAKAPQHDSFEISSTTGPVIAPRKYLPVQGNVSVNASGDCPQFKKPLCIIPRPSHRTSSGSQVRQKVGHLDACRDVTSPHLDFEVSEINASHPPRAFQCSTPKPQMDSHGVCLNTSISTIGAPSTSTATTLANQDNLDFSDAEDIDQDVSFI